MRGYQEPQLPERIVSVYEATLERMDVYCLLAELDEIVSIAAIAPGSVAERVRLYRRVLARRLLSPQNVA